MKSGCLILILFGTLTTFNAFCQSVPGTFRLDEYLIESLESVNADEADYESLLMELEVLRNNPVDLNTCSRADLERFLFLSDFQITSFLNYREEKGKLLSVYELQNIHGFTVDVIRLLLPFVRLTDDKMGSLSDDHRIVRHEATLRLQRSLKESKGYSTPDPMSNQMRYPGSPWLINAHYGLSVSNKVKAGITLEKDPGEELFRGTNRGFDFTSAFVAVNHGGVFKTIVVGDYRLGFGQGLTLWHGAAPGKSSLPLSIVKRQDGIKAYTSNDENNFFRGIATTAVFGRFTLTAFYSANKRDGNITDTVNENRIMFSSFQETGYHRTSSEITDENAIGETAFGANLIYRINNLKVGTTWVTYHLNKFLDGGNEIRDVHEFSGNRLTNFGIDYSLVLKNIQLFGETSYGNKNIATLNGLLVNTGKYASLAVLYRYYDKGFFSLHSSALSEGSDDFNEEGFYTGIVIHPVKKLKISAYADFYSFPWLKYHQSKPASGTDFLIVADYSAGKSTEMYLRFKYEADPDDYLPDSSLIPDITEIERSGIRYHIRYDVTSQLSMQNRVETTFSGSSVGLLIYHDLTLEPDKIPVLIDFRLAWFKTDDYESRIYAYEHDLTSGFSFSPLYDSGIRSYLMATFKFNNSVKFSARYSTTWYADKGVIGSGYDEIESHFKNDLKFRIAITF